MVEDHELNRKLWKTIRREVTEKDMDYWGAKKLFLCAA